MVSSSLKQTDPQKYYFRTLCKVMYYIGMGETWYENAGKTTTISKFYIIWQAVSMGFTLLNFINELLAFLRTDLSDKQREDLFQYCMGQVTVAVKVIFLYCRRQRIMIMMKRLIEGSRSVFYSVELERAAMNLSFKYILVFFFLALGNMLSALFNGYRAHVNEGVPVGAKIVFYPTPKNTGTFVNILRVLVEYHWYHSVLMVLLLDGLAFCSLLSLKCKFQVLQLYFKNMQTKTSKNSKNKSIQELEKDFKNDLLVGIKMHEDTLWQPCTRKEIHSVSQRVERAQRSRERCVLQLACACTWHGQELRPPPLPPHVLVRNAQLECARSVQDSMGACYSIQVVETVVLLVVCLIKTVTSERTTVNLMYNLTYMTCLLLVTAFYMLTAGDITHEASMLPTSIFHCGWELTRGRADLRVLTVVALLRSQTPVNLTAFGVFKLSYNNFIKLLRSSYSFFAVMY